MNNFIQFELWKDCKNGCKFCFNKGQQDVDKLSSLQFVMNKLNSGEMNNYNEVGFIGGEFFDNQLEQPMIKQTFYKMFDICIQKIHQGLIEKMYITTSLLYDMNVHLIPFLNYLRDNTVLENTLLCTSYDLKYRFHTEKRKKMWEDNMILLHNLYPTLKIHTEMIVSGFLIDAVLQDKFSIKDFCQTYNTSVDYIEPCSGFYFFDKKECLKVMPDFFPTKDKFIQFLYKTIIKNKEIDLMTFLSPNLRSNTEYFNYNGQQCILENRRTINDKFLIPNLTVEYEYGFADSNDTMIDIVNDLRQMIMD